jgi:uncharacterized protein YkwD
LNWLDLIIVLVILWPVYMGVRRGFFAGVLELMSIVISVGVPFFLYIPAGRLLHKLHVAQVYSGPLAFLIIWFITLNVYYFGARRLYRRVPRGIRISRINMALGALPGLARGLIIASLLLAVAVSVPNPLVTPRTVEGSVFAPPLIDATTVVTSPAADIFGEAVRAALGFITIEPKSGGRIGLPYKIQNPEIDAAVEEEMLRIVNEERTSRGLKPLVMSDSLRRVARLHSIDMFQKGYFAHDSPDGTTPFQRMRGGGVEYYEAGENIALAPTIRIAHSGLMKSPGHRANILNPAFRRVGIGAARGAPHGIMLTQDFAN